MKWQSREAYRKFLVAAARGEPPAELRALLLEADALLKPLLVPTR